MIRLIKLLTVTALIISFNSCSNRNMQEIPYSVLKKENFRKIIDGKQTNLYFLENGNVRMAVTNYGGRIVSLCTPDKRGEYIDIVLGFISIDEYLKADEVFHGAIIGRVANRIANSKFVLDGKEYTLPNYPDSPNQNTFPSIISNPGDIYQTESIYRFSVE